MSIGPGWEEFWGPGYQGEGWCKGPGGRKEPELERGGWRRREGALGACPALGSEVGGWDGDLWVDVGRHRDPVPGEKQGILFGWGR